MRRRILKVTCLSVGISMFPALGTVFAQTISCVNPDVKSVHQIKDDLESRNPYLNLEGNCGHPGYAAKVKASRPTIDKSIDDLWSNLDKMAPVFEKSVTHALSHRIDYLVPSSGAKKTYQDFGITVPLGNESKVKALSASVWDEHSSADKIRSLTNNLMYRHESQNFSEGERYKKTMAGMARARAELSEGDSKGFMGALKNDSDLKAEIKAKASEKFCIDGYKLNIEPEPFQRNVKLGIQEDKDENKGNDEKLWAPKPELKKVSVDLAAATSLINKPNEEGKILKCTEPVLSRASTHTVPEARPQKIKVGDQFADNQSSIKDPAAFIAKVKSQFPSKTGCITRIKSVQIESSSSLFRNTCDGTLNPEELKKCQSEERAKSYDFLNLSARRAESAKAELIKSFGSDIAFSTDVGGKNGDGTSGPCPYKKDETNDTVRKMYPDELRSVLEASNPPEKSFAPFKYVNLTVDAVQEGENCYDASNSKDAIFLTKQCVEVQIECKGKQLPAK